MTEFDDRLSRLFAETRENPPADDFLAKMAVRLSAARRRRAIRQAVFAMAGAAVAVALTPYVAAGSLSAASHLGAWLPELGHALASPVGWACSLAVAVWGWRRARE